MAKAPRHRRLEGPRGRASRLVWPLIALAVGVVAVVGLVAFFNARDDSGLPPEAPPGRQASEAAGYPLDGETGAPPIVRDRRSVAPAQVGGALRAGNVVLAYAGDKPPRELVELQQEITGAYDVEIAAAGLAVILVPARDDGARPITALARTRMLEADDAADAELRRFIEYWLGRSAE